MKIVPFHVRARIQSLTNIAPIILAKSNRSILGRTVVRRVSLSWSGSFYGCAALLIRSNARFVQIVWFETNITTSRISWRFCHCGSWRGTLLTKIYVLPRRLSLVIFSTKYLLFLWYSFVTNGANLHHSLRTNRTSSWWRSQRINKRVVRLLLGIRTAIKKSNTGRRVLKRTSITNKSSCIHSRCLSFTKRVISITMRDSLPGIRLPLQQKVILTC